MRSIAAWFGFGGAPGACGSAADGAVPPGEIFGSAGGPAGFTGPGVAGCGARLGVGCGATFGVGCGAGSCGGAGAGFWGAGAAGLAPFPLPGAAGAVAGLSCFCSSHR